MGPSTIGSAKRPTRARATTLAAVLAALDGDTHKVHLAQKEHNRARWRTQLAVKARELEAVLKDVTMAIGPAFTRKARDEQRVWHVFANDGDHEVEVARVPCPRIKTFDDFDEPIEVVVLRADLIDVDRLQCDFGGNNVDRTGNDFLNCVRCSDP